MGDMFAEKFAELSRTFRAQLPTCLEQMEHLAALGPEGEGELRVIAHRIAGQGGTFGLPEISQAAAAVEDADPNAMAEALADLSRIVREAC